MGKKIEEKSKTTLTKTKITTATKTTTATSSTKYARKLKQKKPSNAKTSGNNKSSGIVWSKAKKKRMRRLKAQGKFRFDDDDNKNDDNKKDVKNETMNDVTTNNNSCQNKTNDDNTIMTATKDDKSDSNILRLSSDASNDNNNNKRSALQQAYLEKLSGSRFRDLNEELYTTTSDESLKRFRENPELFDQYHKGFRTQVQSWPVNPVDVIRHSLIKLSHQKRQQDKKFTMTIVDFGCGDATLAKELLKLNPPQQQQQQRRGANNNNDNNKPPLFKVHSLDLVSNGNDLITPCDMSHTPLPSQSVDVGVFCLALMGTNIADFVREAHRVLKSPDGILKIAEVRSRFESTRKKKRNRGKSGGGGGVVVDTSLLDEFVAFMTTKMGFDMRSVDRSNKMFFLMDFVKREGTSGIDRNATFTARPCIYKRR